MLAGCRKSPEEADLEKWGDSTDPGSVEGGSQNSTSPRSGGRYYYNFGSGSGHSRASEGHTGASSGGVSRGGFGGHGGGGGE